MVQVYGLWFMVYMVGKPSDYCEKKRCDARDGKWKVVRYSSTLLCYISVDDSLVGQLTSGILLEQNPQNGNTIRFHNNNNDQRLFIITRFARSPRYY